MMDEKTLMGFNLALMDLFTGGKLKAIAWQATDAQSNTTARCIIRKIGKRLALHELIRDTYGYKTTSGQYTDSIVMMLQIASVWHSEYKKSSIWRVYDHPLEYQWVTLDEAGLYDLDHKLVEATN